jgi:hypothetical protein
MDSLDIYPQPVRTEWKLLATLRVEQPDLSIRDIAGRLARSEQTIRVWLRTPLYQAYETWFVNKHFDSLPLALKLSRQEMRQEIDGFAEEMLSRLRDIVETTADEKLVATIGFDILDRADYAAPKREQQRPITLVLTPELLDRLRNREREATTIDAVVVGDTSG